MRYDAVVFDNDGVLVDPADWTVMRTAARATFEHLGVDDPAPDHVDAILRGVSVADLERVATAYGLDPERLWRRRDRDASLVQRAEMVAGRKAPYGDVAALDALACPTGIVSTNQHATIEFELDHFEFPPFDAVYGREPGLVGLRRKKPNPHYVERALADLGVDPGRALYVGDSATDVEAAHAAGADAALLRRPHVDPGALDADPDHVLGGLDELDGLV